ncbi:MBL fold metallo-hydrolase [Pseudomonas sp. KK4]|uniref:MBL fold metallo-hydrolase n=1 Tax=Pseudomonas sp. KK4 TaxID=1855729 RepID=UPI0009F92780|nr:MBL fold metallo-hydrolase [Pseudomonas sp. KK4]
MKPDEKRKHAGPRAADFFQIATLATVSLFATGTTLAADTQAIQDDYFHTGAGHHYLLRADTGIITHTLRDNISVLEGSGGNIVVLTGKDGKFLVDAGIGKSRDKVKAALAAISPAPVKYVVNTHWHWDHTDGNAWMHADGATLVAQVNTLKHLSQTTHVDDWNWTFQPVPAVARPTVLVNDAKTFDFDGSKIRVENFGPGHSDGDLWVYFEKADVLAMGDTFWNAGYPFIDNQDGGSINAAIHWANEAIDHTTDHTLVIPGHGRPAGTRAQVIEFRDMLVGVRDNVAKLKQQGKSLDEVIAAKPTAAFDAKWGHFVIKPDFFVKLVYAGVK